jgi:excisionase family DNA binding protein
VTAPLSTASRAQDRLAVSPREAARLLRCSHEDIYRLVVSGSIPSFRISPHRIRIPVSGLESWMGRVCASPNTAQVALSAQRGR